MRWQLGVAALAFVGALIAALAGAVQSDELSEALARKPNLEHGSSLYETCAACHQPDGAGAADSGIPVVAGQHYEVIIAQLVAFRRTDRVDLRMNTFAARHHLESPQDLADVAAHISDLPAQRTGELGTGQFTAFGAQAYGRACVSCHGPDAAGDGQKRVPRLAGQHFGYLVRQIEAMLGGTRYNLSWDHAALLKTLTEQEIAGVADHLARLKPDAGASGG